MSTSTPWSEPVFHEASEACDSDVERLVQTIRNRVLCLFHRRGLLSDEGEVTMGEEDGTQSLLPLLQAASIQGRVAQGPMAGAWFERSGVSSASAARFVPGSLCAEVDGFSLHAGVWIAALVPPPRVHQQTYHLLDFMVDSLLGACAWGCPVYRR